MNVIGTFTNAYEPNYNFIKIIKYSALCSFAVCELQVSHRQIAKTKMVECSMLSTCLLKLLKYFKNICVSKYERYLNYSDH